jgi:glucans biosynthesis protein
MTSRFDRRSVLRAMTAATVAGLATSGGSPALAAAGLTFGDPEAFSFESLTRTAQDLAAQAYVGPDHPAPDIIDRIDYDAWGKIAFDPDLAIEAQGPGDFPVTFFHLGKFFRKSVEMHVVEGDRERRIIYDPRYFDMPADSAARQLPRGVGFAGLRFQEARDGHLDWRHNDWVAFLGASYFRAIGELYQYGLSARGVALDTAVADRSEEFPDFTKFYIGPQQGSTVTLFALLDGPGIVGAYRFLMSRTRAVVMDIECALFLRRDYARFGIAPLTSMYWFSETAKPTAVDWRPEVHDSDGLAMWTGTGTRLWRPLNNPPRTTASAFEDENPKGFGLLQRDRVFDHYTDGVFYDRRPSLWVEPIGAWGRGAVQLVEIPTDDEIHDNIVAMWVPEAPVQAGSRFDLHYKLHWVADEPYPADLARCVATRLGNGGQAGQSRPKGVRKFMVEFEGAPLASLPFGTKPQPDLWSARGSISDDALVEPIPDGVPGHWRVQFDLAVDGAEPVDLRCKLKLGDRDLTETWSYQYHPF